MGSPLIAGGGGGTGSPLDGPPPQPSTLPPQNASGVMPPGAAPGPGAALGAPEIPTTDDLFKQFATVGSNMDQTLNEWARMAGKGSGAEEFKQARKLIEQGLAKMLGKAGKSPAVNATETGAGFPGGGYGSIK